MFAKLILAILAGGTLAALGYFMMPDFDPKVDLAYTYTPYACLSVYGLETDLRDTVCSWKRPGAYYIGEASKLGFNTIRIPVAIQYLVEANYTILDNLVSACIENRMRFLLDFHRVGNKRQEESWDVGIKEYGLRSRDQLRDLMLGAVWRYHEVSELIGVNSWNEYVGTNATYKQEWDRYVFDEIERLYPGRYTYFPTGLFWGSDLQNYSLEDTAYADRVIYSVHKYPFSGSADRADWETTFGTQYPFTKLFVEEYGFRDLNWGQGFVNYLLEKGIRNHCFWTVAHSGDTGGLWQDDCETLEQEKLEILKPLLFIGA